jgi:hypothetical protein
MLPSEEKNDGPDSVNSAGAEMPDESEALFQNPEQPQLPARELVALGDPAPFGATSVDQLSGIAEQFFGAEPDLDAPAITIAIQALAKVIGLRVQNPAATNDEKRVAVFLISDRPRDLAKTLGAKHEPIIDDGSRSLAGKLWISPTTFISGYSVDFQSGEISEAFQQVMDLNLGAMAACVYNPAGTDREIRFYPNGLNDETRVIKFAVSDAAFDFDTLDQVLNTFHLQNFITPDATLDILDPWKKASKYYPRENAEAFFQAWLKTALSVVFWRSIVVKFEVSGTEGRCDLLMMSRQGEGWLCRAVLELKVLKSYSSSGSSISQTVSEQAIKDGVLQVVAYKTQNASKLGVLCCYDMRKPDHCNDDECFNPIRPVATSNAIHLRRYRVHGSSKALRAVKYGSKVTG